MHAIWGGEEFLVVDEWRHGFLRAMELSTPLSGTDATITGECLENIRLLATEAGFETRRNLSDEAIRTHQEMLETDIRRLFKHFLRQRPAAAMPTVRDTPKVGRNAPCPCGSGKKFKKCCLH